MRLVSSGDVGLMITPSMAEPRLQILRALRKGLMASCKRNAWSDAATLQVVVNAGCSNCVAVW